MEEAWNGINMLYGYEHKPKFLETGYTVAGILTLSICLHYEPHSHINSLHLPALWTPLPY